MQLKWFKSNVIVVLPKIKHDTVCNNYENAGLRNADIKPKIKSLQCSWIKKLFDNSFHEWKLIPIYLIKKSFGENFIFHSNLGFISSLLKGFLTCYQSIFSSWRDSFSYFSNLSSSIKSQFLWYKNINIVNDSLHFQDFSKKGYKFCKPVV